MAEIDMAEIDARTQLIMLLQEQAQPWSTSTPEQVADAIIASGWRHEKAPAAVTGA